MDAHANPGPSPFGAHCQTTIRATPPLHNEADNADYPRVTVETDDKDGNLMKPSGVGPSAPISRYDSIEVPIHLRYSSPLSPIRRPFAGKFDSAPRTWPIGRVPVNGGFYLASTTWRTLIDSAKTVGRDPRHWLSMYPELAKLELLTRTAPLQAYLGRVLMGSQPWAIANDVYLNGAERTAQAAVGYRIGMTMAEFAARWLLGLGPTVHAESETPLGAGPGWSNSKVQPDLVAYRGGIPWLIEAKGGLRIGLPTLRKGAQQLSAPGLMDPSAPHIKVLCGASLTHRLLLTLDIELPPHLEDRRLAWSHSDDFESFSDYVFATSPADAAISLVQSRMLDYYVISSAPTSDRFVRRLGPDRRQPDTPSWAPLPTEDRRQAGSNVDISLDQLHPPSQDFIATSIAGSGITIGLSARLYKSCERNSEFDRLAAESTDRLVPRLRPQDYFKSEERIEPASAEELGASDDVDPRRYERTRSFQEIYDQSGARDVVTRQFMNLEGVSAEQVLTEPIPTRRDQIQEDLESFGGETYVAINRRDVPTYLQ